MKAMTGIRKLVAVSFSMFIASAYVEAGRVVVANDEWTLSNTGFANASDTATFVTNVASLFADGSTGDFLVYSDTFGLTESSLSNTMITAGHTWSISTNLTFDLPTLLSYDAVFLGGQVNGSTPDNQVLIDYVYNGGNIYLLGGTGYVSGFPDVVAEAEAWEILLGEFGLAFSEAPGSGYDNYNGLIGNFDVSGSGHSIFNNVNYLYQGNGSSINDLDINDPTGQILVSYNSHGLYAYAEVDNISDLKIHTAIELEWLATSGLVYQIQWSTNLSTNVWYDLGDPIIGDGTTK